eukprot:Mycagemm_TRINITY_DN1656_c0_g1::TRINITY_DN1656_c0_g1_i1::g.2707::m.2707 type:complete len:143 gc:universal TRINITY_DN1656_c0_g1_i1:1-429(+)
MYRRARRRSNDLQEWLTRQEAQAIGVPALAFETVGLCRYFCSRFSEVLHLRALIDHHVYLLLCWPAVRQCTNQCEDLCVVTYRKKSTKWGHSFTLPWGRRSLPLVCVVVGVGESFCCCSSGARYASLLGAFTRRQYNYSHKT